MKKNLTIGLPKRGVVLCEGSAGFHADCTDEPEGDYDVIANHNNWERVKFLFILFTKLKKKRSVNFNPSKSPYVDEALPLASKITVIRHPLSQLVSSFHYFFKRQYKKKGVNEISIENFEKSMKRVHGKVVFPNSSWESTKVFKISSNF